MSGIFRLFFGRFGANHLVTLVFTYPKLNQNKQNDIFDENYIKDFIMFDDHVGREADVNVFIEIQTQFKGQKCHPRV